MLPVSSLALAAKSAKLAPPCSCLRQRLDGDVVAFGGFAQRPDGGLFPGDVGERVPVIPAHGVLVGHLVDLDVGDVVLFEDLVELLGGTGPHRIRVRVVGFPADVVDTDVVAQLHTDMIGDEAGQEVIAEHLRGLLRAEILTRPRRVHLIGAISALQEVGNPAGAALTQRDLEVGVRLDRLGPQQIRRGLHDVHRLQRDHHIHRRIRGGDRQPARGPDVHVEHRVGIHQRVPHRLPVVEIMEGRIPHRRGVLGERQRVHPALGVAPNLGRTRLGVPDHRQRHRNEARRIGPTPLLDMPVVVGLHQRQGELMILGGEQPAGETGERRKTHRAQDAAGVHVLDPLIDLVAARPDLIQTLGLQAVLLLGPAGHRIQGHVGDHDVAELPGITAVRVVHQPRCLIQVLLLQMILEHVRRLDDVIINADQDHVFFVHACSLPSKRP